MERLTQARRDLQGCARAAESAFVRVEQKGRKLEAELAAAAARTTSRLALLRKRCLAFEGRLDAQVARSRASMERALADRGASAANAANAANALQAAQASAEAQGRGFEAAAASLETLSSGLESLLGTLRGELSACLAKLDAAGAAVAQQEAQGLARLTAAEDAVDALEQRLLAALTRLETLLVEAVDRVKQATRVFVDGIRATLRSIRETIETTTAPILSAANELSRLVTDLQIKAEAAIGQVEKVVATVTGAIDQIPVDALPPPLAKPAVNALEQVSSQFAAQLQTGAKAASGQLQTVSKQLSTTLDQTQEQLTERLGAALEPLLSQLDALTDQIDARREDIQAEVQTQLTQLKTKKTNLLASAKQELDALTAPVWSELAQLCAVVEQGAEEASTAAGALIDASSGRAASLLHQLDELGQRSAQLEASIAAAEAELPRAFARALAPGR